MYILVINQSTKTYPYSFSDLRRNNPQISFPSNPTNELLAAHKVYPVTQTDRPDYDPMTQNLSENQPRLINNVWTQSWSVTQASQEEIDFRLASWRRDLVVSPLQFRRALRQTGLSAQVSSYLLSQDEDVQEAFEYAIEIRRNDFLIESAGEALGKTPKEIDDLFRLAQTL